MNKYSNSFKSAKGFTLLELMVTMVIVGILAAVALPSYKEHINKGNRATARALLLENSQMMERWYTANTTYDGSVLTSDRSPIGSAGNTIKYNLIYVTDAATYSIIALPAGSMVGDSCGNYTITQIGVITNDGAGANCL